MSHPDTPWSAATTKSAAVPAAVPTPEAKDLAGHPDVCVVGGGIAGLTTAYILARSGRSVLVLDAADIGAGETSRSTAHLVTALDDRFHELERLHGSKATRLAAESHAAAIDFIEQLVSEQQIACDFKRVEGYLVSAAGDSQTLQQESEAARQAGLPAAWVEAVPGLDPWAGGAVRFPRQARCDPDAYLQGLWRCCVDLGVRKQAMTRVVAITEGDRVDVETAAGVHIDAGVAVVATNVPFNDRVVLQTKLESYRTYVLAFRVPQDAFPDVLIWDDADPYHYVRLVSTAEGRLLLVGGEDHKTGQGPEDPAQPYAKLEDWTRHHFPQAEGIVHAWSGQVSEPVDGLAYIGLNPGSRRTYVITGDSGNGMTHGTLGGMLVADLIRDQPNPWHELYRPGRVTLGAAAEYAGHNANVARQYGDWLARGDYPAAADIPCGQGGIIRVGVQLQAVFHQPDGRLAVCSAICPHLGGIVRWNAEESTWDCPCHGSRFSPTGTMLHGPAYEDLTILHPKLPAPDSP